MSDYLDVLTIWWSGKPTSGMILGGHSMLWWGRLGKSLQFAAGLVAGLDLLGTAALQARGRSLLDRSRLTFIRGTERRTLSWIIWLRRRVKADFLLDRSFATTAWTAVINITLVVGQPARVPRGLGLTLDAYRDYHQQVIRQVVSEHACSDPHESLCQQQRRYVERRVDELLTAQLPSDIGHLVARADAAELSPFGPSVAVVAFFVGLVYAERAPLLGWLAIALMLVSFSYWAPLWVLALLHRLRGLLERGLGLELRRDPPLPKLRLLALMLFIVGTHFDLLAS